MTDEERQRQMDFILEHQAHFAANMQVLQEDMQMFQENMLTLQEADARAGQRIDRLEQVLKLAIRAGLRERRESREKINALIAAQHRMADAQTHSDQRLDALIDFVQGGGGETQP